MTFSRSASGVVSMSLSTDTDGKTKKSSPIAGYRDEALVSLEEALKAIVPTMIELDDSIETAKTFCNFPSAHGLSHDESAAIYLYTIENGEHSFYKVLNEALRSEDRSKLTRWFPFLKLFVTGLDKLPVYKGNVWRGVTSDIAAQFTKDEPVILWSFSSCSKSVAIIRNFIDARKSSTLLMIEAINGRDISGYASLPHENEVMLGLGTKLRVKDNALRYSELHILHLEEISGEQPVRHEAEEVKAPIGRAAAMAALESIAEKTATGEYHREVSTMGQICFSVALSRKGGHGRREAKTAIIESRSLETCTSVVSVPQKTPSRLLPSCPRCGPAGRVFAYRDYYLDDATTAADHADYEADVNGYVGIRTGVCFFELSGYSTTFICDHKHKADF